VVDLACLNGLCSSPRAVNLTRQTHPGAPFPDDSCCLKDGGYSPFYFRVFLFYVVLHSPTLSPSTFPVFSSPSSASTVHLESPTWPTSSTLPSCPTAVFSARANHCRRPNAEENLIAPCSCKPFGHPDDEPPRRLPTTTTGR
jgi:hypothetical protein